MLVTCATFNYLELLTRLLASHRASNPTLPLLVHAIDWPATALKAAEKAYPDAVFRAQPALTDPSPVEMKGPVPRSAAILKRKVGYLHEAYQESDGPVVWVDADTLLLSSIEPLLARLVSEGDFGVSYRARKRDHAKFAVAVLCFMRTAAAKRLLDVYVPISESSSGTVKRRDRNGVAWFHDQLALWQAYSTLAHGLLGMPRRNRPHLVPLSTREHSIDGNPDAIFVSRRDRVMEAGDMQALLSARGIEVTPVAG